MIGGFHLASRRNATDSDPPSPSGKLVLYNRLPVLRAERGLSRKDLAEAVGVNYQTVGYLERGDYNPSLELAFRLAMYFGLPIEAIFATQPFRLLSEEYARLSGEKEIK